MSLTRRLAAGLPAAGVTVLAALALSGSPAAATSDESARAKQPAVMMTPCSELPRGEKCDYSNGETPAGAGATPDDNGPTRGNGGYGGESPTPSPSATVATVPPGGESPAASPSPGRSTPGGVSAGGTLPLTGAPMGLTIAIGGLMVAGGAAAVYYTRRRRSA